MKKKTVSKTVTLPLADGRKVRVDREKITSVGVGYSVFSKTCKTFVCTRTAKQYIVNLSLDAAKRLIYGDGYEKS